MTCPDPRQFHRRFRHWIGFFFLGVLLVLASASLAVADPAKAVLLSQVRQKSSVPISAPAATSSQRRYRPRTVSRPSGTTLGAPQRGDDFCGSGTDDIGAFTVLAPLSHVGKTTASHPTFAWFIPDTQLVPVSFALFYPATASTPFFTTEVSSQAGIILFTLPPQQSGLKPGRYRWQIQRICFPKSSEATLELEVVQPPLDLEECWYDTFAEALHISSPEKNDQVLSLLRDLQAIEATASNQILNQSTDPNSWKNLLRTHSQRLNQVIQVQKQRLPSQSR